MIGKFPFEIPLPDEGFAEIEWRIRLSEQYGFVEKGLLTGLFDSEVPPTELDRLINAETLKIDEIEKTALVMGQVLVDANQLDNESQTYLLESLGSDFDEPNLEQLREVGKRLLGAFVPRVAAKLATWEIITILKGPESLLELMAVCPRYLGCRYFHHWQHQYQLLRRFGCEEDKRTASERLNEWAKILTQLKSKTKSREYEYWHLTFVYESLVSNIQKIRNLREKPKRQEILLNSVCKVFAVSEIQQGLIVNSKTTARETALDIMISNGDIVSAESFKKVQAVVKKMKSKHRKDAVSLIAPFLDAPTRMPEVFEQIEIWNVLEKNWKPHSENQRFTQSCHIR